MTALIVGRIEISVKIWDYLQTLQVTSSQSITMPSVVSPHAPSSTFLSPLPLTATVLLLCFDFILGLISIFLFFRVCKCVISFELNFDLTYR